MQRDLESTPLIGTSSEDSEGSNQRRTGNVWKMVVVAAVLSAVGVLAVTVNGGLTTKTPGSVKRLQLAKDGTIAYTSLSDSEMTDLFDDFKKTYSRKYDTNKEEEKRFKHFKDFLTKVDKRNEDEKSSGGSALHGLTIFSDLSDAEFAETHLGYVEPSKSVSEGKVVAKIEPYTGPNTNVDWTGIYAGSILDQGYCGSCWAFSASEQIHSDAVRAGILKIDETLSAQQLVSW